MLVAKGAGGPRLQEIIDLARQNSTPIRFEPRPALDRLAGSAAHQGVVALGASQKYHGLEEVLEGARRVVVLDHIQDPQNLGAIVLSAHAAGADAAVIPERRAAGMTETVAKHAAGALEYLPIVRVGNLNRALDQLKERGFSIYGVDERGSQQYDQAQYHMPAAIVLGGEGAKEAPRNGSQTLRPDRAHSDGGQDFFAQRLSSRRNCLVRLETPVWRGSTRELRFPA